MIEVLALVGISSAGGTAKYIRFTNKERSVALLELIDRLPSNQDT